MTPLVLVLPWAVLAGDNRRHGLSRGRIVLTSEYRNARDGASLAVQALRRGRCFETPVAMLATFYEPDRRRKRDILNFSKLLGDVLTRGGAIVDDSLIDDARSIRGPVDARNPRCVVELRPLTETTEAAR